MAIKDLKDFGKVREQVKTIPDTPVGEAAKKFAEESIKSMRKDVPTASKALQSSLGFTFKFENGALVIVFEGDDYWDYVNSGVDGAEQGAGAITNQYGSTYSFKTVNPSQKMVDRFLGKGGQNWMASKGIQARNGDYKSLAYVLARATKKKGIKPSKFVDNALSEDKIQAFEQAIFDAFEKLL